MTEVENPSLEEGTSIKIRPYNSDTSNDTYQEILNRKIAPNRNLLRMEVIKKRKDFNQPYKFSDAEIEKPQQFVFFKEDNLGFVKNMVMEIGYHQLYI